MVDSRADRTGKGAKGRQTEQTIKDAARTVFARDGYLNARIADIAEEAGKSPATLYNYFDDKSDILEVLLDDFLERARLTTTEPLQDFSVSMLRDSIAAFWQTYTEFLPEMVGVTHAAATDPLFMDMWMRIREVGVRSFAHLAAAMQDNGRLDPSLDPYVVASALSSMLEHSCNLWLGTNAQGLGRPSSDEEAINTITVLWSQALGIAD
ncbi:TetR/AcrR family transcriptional regulator [Gordonia sp. (in: high G+C Gram-positive bacteria)]